MCLLWAGSASAARLSGRVELVDKKGRRPAPGVDPTLAVVYFEPDAAPAPPPPPEPRQMVTRGKAFEPQVLVVTRGATVAFPNRDPILHNVFSVSAGNRFDLGLYSQGPGKSWTFERAGVVRVFCNVHHSMVGYVLVLDTRHSARPDARGDFVLDGLPAGPGTVTVWHPRAEPWSRRLVPGGGTRLAVDLDVVLERVPVHLDKFGRSYKRGRRGRYQ